MCVVWCGVCVCVRVWGVRVCEWCGVVWCVCVCECGVCVYVSVVCVCMCVCVCGVVWCGVVWCVCVCDGNSLLSRPDRNRLYSAAL